MHICPKRERVQEMDGTMMTWPFDIQNSFTKLACHGKKCLQKNFRDTVRSVHPSFAPNWPTNTYSRDFKSLAMKAHIWSTKLVGVFLHISSLRFDVYNLKGLIIDSHHPYLAYFGHQYLLKKLPTCIPYFAHIHRWNKGRSWSWR